MVTAFQPIGCMAGDSEGLSGLLEATVPLAGRGIPVVLAGWGPPERCTTSSVLRVATKLAEPLRSTGMLAPRAPRRPGGGRPAGGSQAGRLGTGGLPLRVRGHGQRGPRAALDGAVRRGGGRHGPGQVDKELTEALHPHERRDGTVWMPNVFRYLIARTRLEGARPRRASSAGPPVPGGVYSASLVSRVMPATRYAAASSRVSFSSSAAARASSCGPVLAQLPAGALVALVDDPPHLVVDRVEGAGGGREPVRLLGVARQGGETADAFAHAPAADHAAGDVGDLLQVVLGARGDDVEDDLFGGHAAQGADDAAAQILLRVRVLVGVRRGQGDAQRAPARARW